LIESFSFVAIEVIKLALKMYNKILSQISDFLHTNKWIYMLDIT